MPYECYYDDEARKIVQEADAEIFRREGYTFSDIRKRSASGSWFNCSAIGEHG